MAEIRVRVTPFDDLYDEHGHPLRLGIEVLIVYRDTIPGQFTWNTPRQLGCICPMDDTDPDCPLPVTGGPYAE